MTDTALAPCPFCGGVPEIATGSPGCHYVRCKGCSCSTDDCSRDRAIALWNRRAPAHFLPTHRHRKRGSVYQRLGGGQLQAARPVGDLAVVTIYRAEDGSLWVRPTEEFEDGRFEAVP